MWYLTRLFLGSLLLLHEAAADLPQQQVTLDLYGVPLLELSKQLEQQFPLHFSIPEPLMGMPVSATVRSLPLDQAVEQLLAGFQYAMVEGDDGLIQVYLFGIGEMGEQPKPTQYLPETVEEPSRQLVIRTDHQGRYMAQGRVNGAPTQFLVDTGANWLVLGREIAEMAEVVEGKPVEVKTANGLATGYWTEIRALSLGELYWNNVEAIVLPELESPPALLGMNLLKTVDMDMSGERLLLKQLGTEN